VFEAKLIQFVFDQPELLLASCLELAKKGFFSIRDYDGAVETVVPAFLLSE